MGRSIHAFKSRRRRNKRKKTFETLKQGSRNLSRILKGEKKK